MRRFVPALALMLVATTAAVAGETASITLPSDSLALKAGPGLDPARTACRLRHPPDYITPHTRGTATERRSRSFHVAASPRSRSGVSVPTVIAVRTAGERSAAP